MDKCSITEFKIMTQWRDLFSCLRKYEARKRKLEIIADTTKTSRVGMLTLHEHCIQKHCLEQKEYSITEFEIMIIQSLVLY